MSDEHAGKGSDGDAAPEVTTFRPESEDEVDPPSSGVESGHLTDVSIRDVRIEAAVAAVAVVFGLALLWFSRNIRAGSVPDPITSAGLARLAGIMIAAFASALLLRALGRWRSDPSHPWVRSEGDDDEVGHVAEFWRPMVIVGISFAWAYGMTVIGFFLATPVLIALVLLIMKVRTPGKLIAVPIGFTILIWILFYEVLGIMFPLGFMEALLREIGFI